MIKIKNTIVSSPVFSNRKCNPLLAAAIPAFAGLVGDFLGASSQEDANATNLQIAREQNQFNLQQWSRERDFTKEMWQRNNEYNDPANQMRRLTAAGLSPVAAASVLGAGDSQAVSTPSGKPASGAVMQAYKFDNMASAAQGAVAAYQAEQKNQAEIKLINEQARAAAADADQREMYNGQFAEETFRQQLLALMHGNKKTWYEAEEKMKDVMKYDSRFDMEMKAQEASIGLMQVQSIQGQLDALLKDAELSFISDRQKAQLALLAAQAYAAKASGDQAMSQKDLNELMQNNMPELTAEQRKTLSTLLLGQKGADFLSTLNNANLTSTKTGPGYWTDKIMDFVGSNIPWIVLMWLSRGKLKGGKVPYSVQQGNDVLDKGTIKW